MSCRVVSETDKATVTVTWQLHRRSITSTVAVLELLKYIIIYSLLFIYFTLSSSIGLLEK